MKKRLFALLLTMALLCAAYPVTAEGVQYGYVNIDTSLYASASADAEVKATVSLGAQVRIEEETEADGALWYKVTLIASKETGWMKGEDVDLAVAKRLGQEEAVAEATPEPAGEAAPEPAPEATEEPAASEPVTPTKVSNEDDFPVLTATGNVDPAKLQGAPKLSDYKELKMGDSGKRVEKLKVRLAELGYLPSNRTDGAISNQDITAIRSFQRNNGLEIDGVISKKLQLKLFSSDVIDNTGNPFNSDAIIFTRAQAVINNSGGTITFMIKGNSAEKIDAFDFRFRFWNTYGERYLLKTSDSKAKITEELTLLDFSEERVTLSKGQSISFSFNLGSSAIPRGQVAITAYHTQDGKTVRIDDDQLNWYSFEKGKQGSYAGRVVTPLTDKEISLAKGWDTGITGSYVDAETAEAYNLREGLYVTKVAADSPAAKAGLKKGDVLLAIGNVRIFGASSLVRAASYIKAGKSAVMLFLRKGVVYQTEIARPGKD